MERLCSELTAESWDNPIAPGTKRCVGGDVGCFVDDAAGDESEDDGGDCGWDEGDSDLE